MHFFIFTVLSAVLTAAFEFDAEAQTLLQDRSMGPVAKVRAILEDMSKQLDKDKEDDEDLNEEMMCWCKSNIKEKTKVIADNSEKSDALRSSIESLRAKSERLNTEMSAIDGEVKTNQGALDTAVSLRKQELKEFTAAEGSAQASIGALDGAQNALAAGLPKAMMQDEVSLGSESAVVKALRKSIHGHHEILWAIHSEKEQKVLEDLMAHSRDIDFIQGGSSNGRVLNAPYAIIHGTIQSLKDAFQKNLKQMQGDEMDSSAAHEAMKAAKKKEIAAGLDMIDAKTAGIADTDEQAAAAREELDDTEAALAADRPYLVSVKERCALHEKEYQVRIQTRTEESAAVTKAIFVLGSDENRNTFTKTLGHTKRPSEGKLGSRALKEYKEERETQSMRSQTNAARKNMWGTSDQYLLFLQTDRQPHHKEASSLAVAQKVHSSKDSEPKKLADLAARTQAYWASKYYMDAKVQNATAEQTKTSKGAKQESTTTKAPRNQLGLTAQQVKMRKNAMADASEGVTKMRESLELQQGEEAARKEWCVTEINTVEKQIDNTARKKKDQEEKIQLMAERMARLTAEIRGLNKQQDDANIELAKAGIDRKKANTGFQKTVANQNESKRILAMALQVLEGFYGKRQKKASLIRQKSEARTDLSSAASHMRLVADAVWGDALSFDNARNEEMAAAAAPARRSSTLIQANQPVVTGEWARAAEKEEAEGLAMVKKGEAIATAPSKAMLQAPAGPPPPPGFKSYGNAAASGGVLVMVSSLIDDCQAMVEEAVRDETDAMKAYEAYVAASNADTVLRNEAITDRRMELGKLEEFTVTEKVALNETKTKAANLRQYDIDLYGVENCAYLLKNYETRFMERQEEIASLKEAEAILGAGGGDAKLTKLAHGDDDTLAEKAAKGADAASNNFKVVEDGVEVEAHHPANPIQPEDEKATLHMAAGTQVMDTGF